MGSLSVLVFGFSMIMIGVVSLLLMRSYFSKLFRRIKESHLAAEIKGPLDNFGVVAELVGNVRAVYSPVGGGRYISREKTVLLSYPPGSKGLWALLEAAHEAGHAAKPHPLTELLASTPLRLAISMVAPVAISFFVGWRVPHQAISLALLAVLLSFPLIALAAITQEEVGACLFSRRWMCSYLDGQGYETYQGAVAKMIHAEVAFEILDGFALLLFFEGAIVLFWGLGRTLI